MKFFRTQTLVVAARAPLSRMEPQAAEKQQQWHAAIGLAEFVAHVANLQHVVDVCNTAELGLIDRAKLKNIMQWGLFIEQVGLRGKIRICVCFESSESLSAEAKNKPNSPFFCRYKLEI